MAVIPLGILIAGIAIAVVGAGVGAWQAVEARNRAAEEADAIAEQKEKEAEAARQSALYAEQQHRRRIAILSGRTQAITAAAGVSTAVGSPVEIDLDLSTQSELEALNIRRTGELEGIGREFEARLARYRAETQRSAIKFDVASNVLSAASSSVTSYSSYKGYNQSRKQMYFTSQG